MGLYSNEKNDKYSVKSRVRLSFKFTNYLERSKNKKEAKNLKEYIRVLVNFSLFWCFENFLYFPL